MKSLTDDRPKCLVDFRGKPLLDWQIGALREAGVEEIGVVTGYRREMLAARGLKEFHNPRWAQTQMVSSLACASSWLQERPCIVSYSDIFYAANAIRSLIETAADIAITYDPNWLVLWKERFTDPLIDAETFRLRADGRLAEIGLRPKTVEEVQGQYMGLLRFTPRGWSEVKRIRSLLTPAERDTMHMTGTLQKIVEAGRLPIAAVPYAGQWGEFDSDQDLLGFGGS